MRMIDILERKRDGVELTKAEIDWVIASFSAGDLPDYQMSALLMAILLRGMTRREISQLTQAMTRSGKQLSMADMLGGYAVDKHSSGGVGDKVSLVVLPLVAACGAPVAKMSGRALGYTGGTLDKLESIAGFDVAPGPERFAQLAREVGLVIGGQNEDLAPADGLIYALRDVTGTVPSIPLIASSIMSKKIAAGADGIVLDVKVGEGAFMRELAQGRELAQQMVRIGEDAGRDMIAVISNMNQPLGEAVGNALEVHEALDTLRGGGPADLREHSLDNRRTYAEPGGSGRTLDGGLRNSRGPGTAPGLRCRPGEISRHGDRPGRRCAYGGRARAPASGASRRNARCTAGRRGAGRSGARRNACGLCPGRGP